MKTKYSKLRSDLNNLLRRSRILVEQKNYSALQDLQRLVLRPIQTKHMLDAYLKPDHRGIGSLEAFRDFGIGNIPGINKSLYDFLDQKLDDIPEVKLGRDTVLPTCWNPASLLDIGTIGEKRAAGPWRQDPNHNVSWWYPINIYWVIGGNHSIFQGIISCEGSLKPNSAYDISALYEYIKFDGQYWRSLASNKKIGKPLYPEFGQAFEIGRILISKT